MFFSFSNVQLHLMSAEPHTQSNQQSQPKKKSRLASIIFRYSPLISVLAFIVLFGILGYLAGGFLGQILGTVYGQASAANYMAASVINQTSHQAATVLGGLGSYYYLQALTVPNVYSMIGLGTGALLGMLVGLLYYEHKAAEEEE